MYGTKGGASQECFKKYSTCDADEVHKSLSFCPTAADYSVLLGFARDTKWTAARSCPCEGCRHRPDSRPAPPGDKERGNSISPPSFLLLMRLLYRQVGGLPDSEALSLARQAEIQTLAFEMGEKALYAKATSYLSEGAPAVVGSGRAMARPWRPAAVERQGQTIVCRGSGGVMLTRMTLNAHEHLTRSSTSWAWAPRAKGCSARYCTS